MKFVRLAALFTACCLLLCSCGGAPIDTPTTTQPAQNTAVITTTISQTATSLKEVTTLTTSQTTKPSVTKVTSTVNNTTGTTVTTTSKMVTTTTAPPVKPLRVLSIGHSLSNDAHSVLAALAEHEGTPMETFNLLYSACSLKQHYEFWQGNQAEYWPVSNGFVDWNTKITLTDALEKGKWDIITIQESPNGACSVDNMLKYGKMLYYVIKNAQPSAKIFIHQTWALADGNKYHTNQTGGSMDTMWSLVKPNYDTMSKELNLPLIPSGEAMYNMQKAYDARGKGESIYRDGLHADEGWGFYMLALIWYRVLTGKTPSNTFEAFRGPYIEDAKLRELVYTTAMNAVDAYYPD